MLPLRVLFIGDSYTYFNNLPRLVGAIAQATPGRKIQAERVTASAYTLRRHWLDGKARTRIREARWDVVVLQEENTIPLSHRERFGHDVRLFVAEIRRVRARPLLFSTWAQRAKPLAQAPMTAAVEGLGFPVASVGEAWRCWQADPAAPTLFVADGCHPNFRGSYLSALVLVGALRGRPLATAPTAFGSTLGVAHAADGKPFVARIERSELPRLLRCADAALSTRKAQTGISATEMIQNRPTAKTLVQYSRRPVSGFPKTAANNAHRMNPSPARANAPAAP